MRPFLLIIIIVLAISSLAGQAISAVWVLPWDLVRESSIDSVLTNLQANGQNTLLAEVRYRADAIYTPNKRVDAYSNLDVRSHIMKASDFDALEYLLQEAGKYGIKVHAWITTFVVTGHDLTKLPENHIYFKHPEWITTDLYGNRMPLTSAEGYFLDPGIPEVRQYTMNVINDLLLNYPQLAGLHLDYIRYPGEDYGFNPLAIREYGPDFLESTYGSRMLWKESIITNFVSQVYSRIKELNPRLELSAAVIADKVKGRAKYSQNWQEWLDKGIIDKVYMMAYTKDDATLARQLDDYTLQAHKDKIVVGLRAWDDGQTVYPAQAITSKIQLSRQRAFNNIALFSYGGIMARNNWINLRDFYVKERANIQEKER